MSGRRGSRKGRRPSSSQLHPEVEREQKSMKPSPPPLPAAEGEVEEKSPAPIRVVVNTQFPPRPAHGTSGRRIKVLSNHFKVNLAKMNDIYHYDIAICKEGETGDDDDLNKALRGRVIQQVLSEKNTMEKFGAVTVVSDGRKNIYTPTRLSKPELVFNEVFPDDEMKKRNKSFTMIIREADPCAVRTIQLRQLFTGRANYTPYDVIQGLDIALRHTASAKYVCVGRNFFNDKGAQNLGEGAQVWFGYHQSLRATQNQLSLNIDTAATAFLLPGELLEFLKQVLGGRELPSSFNRYQYADANKALRGIKVTVTHRETKRFYRINGLSKLSAEDTKFEREDGTKQSVAQYFAQQYKIRLKYPRLPCVHVGSPKGNNYLPIEVCNIPYGQKVPRKVTDRQVATMIRFTCAKPENRRRSIEAKVRDAQFNQDPNLKAFGLQINPRMMEVQARVLPEPEVVYFGNKIERPRDGSWNMKGKGFYQPMKVKSWAVISLCDPRRCSVDAIRKFVSAMMKQMPQVGMQCPRDPPPILDCSSRSHSIRDSYRQAIDAAYRAYRNTPADFVLVVKPDQNAGSYGDVKRASDTEFGVVSQCMLSKHIQKCSPQYIANILLKINVKLGGKNSIIQGKLPKFSDIPTIIFGADVSHPSPMDRGRPSIAAVSASMDQFASSHAGILRKQGHRVEQIEDLQTMVYDLLRQFYRQSRLKPSRILFFRDGVSEGQFDMVVKYEVQAIRRACALLEPNYNPPITFVVVQKRHHTRFFPMSSQDADRSGNVRAGTVIESEVCHPTQFDFYLMSHGGLQGTSCPAHYHVLADENNFTPDELQNLCFKLCHLYVRCCKSVSIVPAVYYAHLIAFRARFFLEDSSETGSVASLESAATVKMYDVHQNLLPVMYFA